MRYPNQFLNSLVAGQTVAFKSEYDFPTSPWTFVTVTNRTKTQFELSNGRKFNVYGTELGVKFRSTRHVPLIVSREKGERLNQAIKDEEDRRALRIEFNEVAKSLAIMDEDLDAKLSKLRSLGILYQNVGKEFGVDKERELSA